MFHPSFPFCGENISCSYIFLSSLSLHFCRFFLLGQDYCPHKGWILTGPKAKKLTSCLFTWFLCFLLFDFTSPNTTSGRSCIIGNIFYCSCTGGKISYFSVGGDNKLKILQEVFFKGVINCFLFGTIKAHKKQSFLCFQCVIIFLRCLWMMSLFPWEIVLMCSGAEVHETTWSWWCTHCIPPLAWHRLPVYSSTGSCVTSLTRH